MHVRPVALVLATVLSSASIIAAPSPQAPPPLREKFASPKAPDLAPWKALRPAVDDSVEAQTATPYRVFDNVYYVGTRSYSSYVVTTDAGLVLIDATWANTANLVLDNIKAVGLNPAEIKYILITHGHGDHAAGAQVVQAATHARVAMAAEDWTLYEK